MKSSWHKGSAAVATLADCTAAEPSDLDRHKQAEHTAAATAAASIGQELNLVAVVHESHLP